MAFLIIFSTCMHTSAKSSFIKKICHMKNECCKTFCLKFIENEKTKENYPVLMLFIYKRNMCYLINF